MTFLLPIQTGRLIIYVYHFDSFGLRVVFKWFRDDGKTGMITGAPVCSTPGDVINHTVRTDQNSDQSNQEA